jgi:hypothetical protein
VSWSRTQLVIPSPLHRYSETPVYQKRFQARKTCPRVHFHRALCSSLSAIGQRDGPPHINSADDCLEVRRGASYSATDDQSVIECIHANA